LVEYSTLGEFIRNQAQVLIPSFQQYNAVCERYLIAQSEPVKSFLWKQVEEERERIIVLIVAVLGYPHASTQTPCLKFQKYLFANCNALLDKAWKEGRNVYPGTFVLELLNRTIKCWHLFFGSSGEILIHPGLKTREGVIWHLRHNIPVKLEILNQYPDLLAIYGVP
jgi:hypothetical protein